MRPRAHVRSQRRMLGVAGLLGGALTLSWVVSSSGEGDSALLAELRLLTNPPRQIQHAELLLVARCLRVGGIDLDEGSMRPAPMSVMTLAGVGPVLETDRVMVEGYGAAMTDPQVPADPMTDAMDDLAPDHRAAAQELVMPSDTEEISIELPTGLVASAPDLGCFAEARQRLYGSVHDFLAASQLPQVLRDSAETALTLPPVTAALGDYRRCMDTAGVPARYPSEAARSIRQALGARTIEEAPTSEELQQAAKDASCQHHSRINEAIDHAVMASADEWLTLAREDISLAARVLSRAAERADVVVEESGRS